MLRRSCAVLTIAFLAAAVPPVGAEDSKAQVSLETGLVNHGQLATEVTHRVRTISMPGSLFVGAAIDDRLVGELYLTAGGTLSVTTLTKTRCAEQPCQGTHRDYRPGRIDPIELEHTALFVTPRIGLRYNLPGPIDVAAGAAFPTLQTAYSLVAASPMTVKAVFAELQARGRIHRADAAAFARSSWIAPDDARWVALSEHAGYKRNGEPFPNGKHDPLWIQPFEAGLRLYLR